MDCMNGTRGSYRSAMSTSAVGGALLSLLLAACSGSTGPAGPAGPAGTTGPVGPTGPGAGITALDVATATSITGTVTSVAISGPPVVKFRLADQNGVPLKGLPAADLGWVIAQLVPGQNGTSSQWNSYIYETVTPAGCPSGVAACDTAPKVQATVENAATGTLVDNGDGTYQYTFHKDITKDPSVVYSATLTHRVGFEIRGLVAQANNADYTFQPSTGATTGIFMREIVETSTCDNCHTFLNAHGGARVEVQYCVMCHSPGTTDPYSGSTLDMKVMIHKIHTGNTLPTIQTASGPNTAPTLGIGYWIVGYMESLNNFNTVLYPAGHAQLHDLPCPEHPRRDAGGQLLHRADGGGLRRLPRQRELRHRRKPQQQHRRERLAVHHLSRPNLQYQQWHAAGHRRAYHSRGCPGGQVQVRHQQRQLQDQRRQRLSGGEFLGRRSDQWQYRRYRQVSTFSPTHRLSAPIRARASRYAPAAALRASPSTSLGTRATTPIGAVRRRLRPPPGGSRFP